MKILYFARIRQIAGKSSEDVDLPASVATVADLIDHLSARDERRTLRAAVDQNHVALEASVRGAREVAFFPPVTGG
jgi:molybdopterin synthase sulfur carrier subunit